MATNRSQLQRADEAGRRTELRHISLGLEAALDELRPPTSARLTLVPDEHDPSDEETGRAETADAGSGYDAA
jgi:hypothetical protein